MPSSEARRAQSVRDAARGMRRVTTGRLPVRLEAREAKGAADDVLAVRGRAEVADAVDAVRRAATVRARRQLRLEALERGPTPQREALLHRKAAKAAQRGLTPLSLH
eukprot:CAMPEP_0205878986 /NCGR_PEP_ID=MMETSP1083-20121108/15154_1 /ASSEMBLY_ACC=CAM_ASM_000430 /TAXON_ID=97485 /ORGANISM="Prymnesium parvum, Strain Texoma1" /LENGTH=106 /DNA_ID=CAMNT_0053241911 /DNA_START=139 /DNA_END=460 /DNA_ORIENTATION=-